MSGSMVSRLPGGPKTVVAFLAILFAYTVQTESTQHIQHALRYEKPLLLLYVTHSSFTFLLPIQLLVLRVTTGRPISHFLGLLKRDVQKQLDHVRSKVGLGPAHTSVSFFLTLLSILVLIMLGITIPAVSWFVALPLTSMANVTSIYNTFSIWALVFSVIFLNEEWNYLQAFAVLLGVVGVGIVSYASTQPVTIAAQTIKPIVSRAMLGNSLALLGAISMAAYEVLYKLIATVPDENHAGFRPLASSPEHADEHATHHNEDHEEAAPTEEPLPFGMHAMAMTSGIGLTTFVLLWAMLLVAHLVDFEPLALPPNGETFGWIVMGASCGMIFNGCFSILLSLWGPVLASMSCLLTTVIVQLTDLVLGVPCTWTGLAGCAVIAVSFVCLLPWENKG